MASVPVNVLFGQSPMEPLRFFVPPVTDRRRIPLVFLLIHADFSLPFWIEKIIPILRRIFWRYHFRVITNYVINILDSCPVTLRVFKLLRISLKFL